MAVTSPPAYAVRSAGTPLQRRLCTEQLVFGLVERDAPGTVEHLGGDLLTSVCRQVVHEHRLWEMYLIAYADVAPAKVDRDADAIEHVLDPAMIGELEELLKRRQSVEGVAASPHPLGSGAGASPSREGV